MSFHSIPPLNPIDTLNKLSQSTLIIPTISVGNIPQLCIDLLIHNLDCKLIARLDDDYLYPFTSPIDFINEQQDGISTALEVYYNDNLKITILQQRSPILPGLQNKFLNNLLIPFITNIEFNNLIILNSQEPDTSQKRIKLFANNLTNLFNTINLEEDNIESVSNFNDLNGSFLQTLLTSLQQESHQMKQTTSEINLYNQLKENFPTSLPLSRASSSIYSIKTLSILVLQISSYEGDNSNDLIFLTRELLKILKIDNSNSDLQNPKSWDGFYGTRDVPIGIEGLYS